MTQRLASGIVRERVEAVIEANGDFDAAATGLGVSPMAIRSTLVRLHAPTAPKNLRALVLRDWLASGGLA